MRSARVLAGVLAVVLGLGLAVTTPQAPAAHADPPTTGTTVAVESFTGSSVTDPAWQALGSACLTGRPETGGTGSIPSCASYRAGPVPPMGVTPGYLQLTDGSGSRAGSILYNRPIPATAGVSITFDQFQYSSHASGADGIGFFLVDGSTNLDATGGYGGSLGYAQRGGLPGVEGAYVGVGLDAYGNFYNDGDNRGSGCPAGQQSPRAEESPAPNVITVRGPGDGTVGYCWQGATVDSPVAHPTSTLDGRLRVQTSEPEEAVRRVNIQVTPLPDPHIIVQIQYTPGGPWVEELNIPAPPNTPTTYKLGLSASTGGLSDVHLIRGAVVDTIEPLEGLQLEKQVDRSGEPLPAVITAGTRIPYVYTVTNAGDESASALTITDNLIDGVTCLATVLEPAPAIGSTTTCTGTYEVTAADVTAGQVTNAATATATALGGDTVVSNVATLTVPLRAALAVTKEVLTPPPYADYQQVTYGYEVTNVGNTTLATVSISDDLIPASSIVCQADVLAPEAVTTCTGTYWVDPSDVNDGGFIVNTATASALTPFGRPVASEPVTEEIPVATDVAVGKSVDDVDPLVGQDVTFTMTARNNGPSVAQDVELTDQLPAGRLTYVSHETSTGTYTESDGLWQIPEIAVGQTVNLTLIATVNTNADVTNGVSLTSMTQADINPSNNAASVTLNRIEPISDIAVTKTVADGEIPLGAMTTFTVTAHNGGPDPATSLVIRDGLPSGLDAVSWSGPGTFDPSTGLWDVGSLAVDADATLELVVQPLSLGRFRNTAAVDVVQPQDTNPGNDTDFAAITVRAPSADLAVSKVVDPETVIVGDSARFSVTATNHGPELVDGVYVLDAGSDGVEVGDAVEIGQGFFDPTTGLWDIGTLEPNDSVTLTYWATVLTEGTHANTATVTAPALTDTDPENNTATATLVTQGAPLDLGVTKTVDDDEPGLGQTVTYTLTATHTPDPADPTRSATNVVFGDVLPEGITYVSSTGDGDYDPATGTWTFATIAPGATVTLTITATVDAVGTLTNTVSLVSLDQRDTDPANNSAGATVTVTERADLALTKTTTPEVAQPGDTVTYTITVENLGPSTTDDVEVVDPFPSTANITGWEASGSTSFDVDARLWDVGTLTFGQVETLTVDVLLGDRDGSFANEVVLARSRVLDPIPGNDAASSTLFVPMADIEVTNDVDDAAPYLGQQVTFTITANNLGPDHAEGVTVAHLLPAGLTFVSATADLGSYDPATGVWSIGDLAPRDRARTAAQAVLEITALVAELGTHETVASSDREDAFPFDADPANNSDTAVVTATIPPTDLSVAKTADPPSVQLGTPVTFTITTTVSGPGDANGVIVEDVLPEGLVPTAATVDPDGDGCTITDQTVLCVLGDLVVGDVVVVTVTAAAGAVGELTNAVTVATSSPEQIVENNTASIDVVVTAPPAPGPPPAPPAPDPELPPTGTQPLGTLAVAVLVVLLGTWLIATSRRRQH